ncbi:MAG: glutathione S-transferase family protein [Maricaulaceae bacterium]|nr:glutathione S-transferase family protein [Maricaulaceae bacterium]
MAKDLILYTHPQSRGRIARWMLEEAGADYRVEAMSYGNSMKSPEYLAINPMGKVPAIRHGDQVITECAAICAYVADAFPNAGLAPPPGLRGAYYRWLFFAAGPLEAAIVNKALGVAVSDKQKGFVGYGSLDEALNAIAGAIAAGKPWIAGDRFSAADVYIGAQIGWGLQFGTIEARPEFADYAQRIQAREAYKRAKEKDDALAKELGLGG